ncbi:MAG: aldehyde dehydrogenase [Bacteroidetes bacterium HGW-Bacteroidetes-2]|jgi:aldehyde dehydrogenase (NAD+)|nr:MAG: aldehyde dehydrogenase [Bacteroidetes bacterium HGW-Bacteroidetes-2]
MPTSSTISNIKEKQNNFFAIGKTKEITFRKEALKKLLAVIQKNEEAICNALYSDFKKSKFESLVTEVVLVVKELQLSIKNIDKWTKPKTVKASFLNFPSKDLLYTEPYGTVLIIAPWNYPYQLVIAPLIGAIAAGNTVVIKPSELTPATSALLENIISETFSAEYILVIQGNKDTAQELLQQKWDYIFFTGSVKVGKIIAKAAAKHLTPMTLELGGKNPCIIDETAKLKLSARRIVWGKFVNAGQTCIAPDYLLVHKSIETDFIKELQKEIVKAYGENPKTSKDYPRIINTSNFERLSAFLKDGKVLAGGECDNTDLYISPTLLQNPSLESEVMQEEIFGPILPILTYLTAADLEKIILRYEKSLALYVFSENKVFAEKVLKDFSFGGGATNDVMIQFVNHRLPFGGVGSSGMGAYHGKHSFETFSHKKSITKKGTWLDIPFRYAPYGGKTNLIKKISKWI